MLPPKRWRASDYDEGAEVALAMTVSIGIILRVVMSGMLLRWIKEKDRMKMLKIIKIMSMVTLHSHSDND